MSRKCNSCVKKQKELKSELWNGRVELFNLAFFNFFILCNINIQPKNLKVRYTSHLSYRSCQKPDEDTGWMIFTEEFGKGCR